MSPPTSHWPARSPRTEASPTAPAPTPGAPAPTPRPSIRVGTAGWSIPRAVADSFPAPGAHLERYSRVLPCSEINATFYRSPHPSTYARWTASTPETFRFSVKAPKSITHISALACTPAELQLFLDEARQLGGKLGPILVQLPPKLAFDPARAETFFALLRSLHTGPVALEPRHPTWFTPEADSLLNQLQIARVAADPAITPSAAHPGGHPSLLYLRLHGSPRTYYSPYTPEFLAQLAADLRQSSSPEIWCIFDNTASGAAAANALTLLQSLLTPDSQPELSSQSYLPR